MQLRCKGVCSQLGYLRDGADDFHPGAVLQVGQFAAVRLVADCPAVKGGGILEDRLRGGLVVTALHLFIVKSDASVGGRKAGNVTAVHPEGHPGGADVETERVVHGVGDVGFVDLVERRIVILIEGGDPEVAGGGWFSGPPEAMGKE